jgi:hypothetical protein
MPDPITSFELRVTFCGLCLYVDDQVRHEVTILMPDARLNKGMDRVHDDGTKGEHHVGFLRADLGSMDATIPRPTADADDEPHYAFVHRFDRESISFGLEDVAPDAPIVTDLLLPDLDKVAGSNLVPIDDLLAPTPPDHVLFRTVLKGGKIIAKPAGKTWGFHDVLNRGADPHTAEFAGSATWTRTIVGDHIDLTIAKLDGSGSYTRRLEPVSNNGSNAVVLKVSNLCAHNPMEWDDLEIRTTAQDVDFKWFYKLVKPTTGDYQSLLKGFEFPFPTTLPGLGQPEGGEDCIGLKIIMK